MALENRQNGPRNSSSRIELAHEEQRAHPAPERHPDLANAHMRRGIRLYGEDRFAEALTEFRTAVQLDPTDFHAQICLANTLLDLHRAEEALSAFRRAIRLAPRDGRDIIRNLGYSLPGI